MQTKTLSFDYQLTTDIKDLPENDRELIAAAQQATETAYAPYSHFSVGAALRLEDGTILTGSNQENASYPAGLCAERTVLFYAQANHPGKAVTAMALATKYKGVFTAMPTSPCGPCRQVLLEAEKLGGQPIRLMLWGTKQTMVLHSIRDILPFGFDEVPKS